MPRDKEFHEYVVHDLLKDISRVTSRAMFGGWGIYRDGIFFALIANGELYFKVDGSNRSDYEKLDSHSFVYSMKDGKKTTMSYWQLPEEIMENSSELEVWVEKAVGASIRSKQKSSKKKPNKFLTF